MGVPHEYACSGASEAAAAAASFVCGFLAHCPCQAAGRCGAAAAAADNALVVVSGSLQAQHLRRAAAAAWCQHRWWKSFLGLVCARLSPVAVAHTATPLWWSVCEQANLLCIESDSLLSTLSLRGIRGARVGLGGGWGFMGFKLGCWGVV